MSLRSHYNYYDAEFHNRQLLINSTRALLSPLSNAMTMLQSTSTTSSTVRWVLGGNSQNKFGNTGSISPAIEYKRDSLALDGTVAFSQSINHYADLGAGFFLNYDAWIFPMTWRLDRSSGESKSWDFTQLSGRSPYVLANYQSSAQTNNATSTPKNSRDQQWSAQGNAKWIAPWRVPTFFKAGFKAREELYRLANYSYSWTYVGPDNNRTTAVVPVSPDVLDPHKGGNLFDPGFQFPDRTALASIFAAHPEYFTPNPSNATSDANRYPNRYVKEQINAAYAMGKTRLNRLSLQAGVRVEETKDGSKTYERGIRQYRSGNYTDVFGSGAATYAFTPNLRGIASFSQALLRPDFGNLTGVASINDTNQTGTIPNPELKPEHSNNYSARLEYYFEPVGTLSAGYFENDITDVQFSTASIPAEELGLGQDYPGYTFTSTRNAALLKVKGFELEYSQQLTFLPGVFRGLGVFANYTRTQASDLILAGKRAPRVASGGVSFRYHDISTSLKCVWTDDTFDSSVASATNNALRYQRARTMFDLSLSAPVPYVKRTTFFVSGRNLFNAPAIIYENTRSLVYQHDQFGVTWTMGLKGTF
jgi:TonB-dependent receptor